MDFLNGNIKTIYFKYLAAAFGSALITSIYSHHDNIVAPQSSAQLPGARNLAFGGIGHVALASDARVLRQLLAEIAIKCEVAQAPSSPHFS